jgi:acetyl-CoA C-acetyltransferase
MIAAAAMLAERFGVTRAAQDAFAVESHRKARYKPPGPPEIVPLAGLAHDAFARALTPYRCRRVPPIAGVAIHGVTRATVAVEADAAAALLVVSKAIARRLAGARPVRIVAARRRGGDPTLPGTAPIAAAREVLKAAGVAPSAVAVAEVMEAFAVQAMVCIDGIGLDPVRVNREGGALARGHPIGASGAILAVRLWQALQREAPGAQGLAAIAAAGGLGSALLLSV